MSDSNLSESITSKKVQIRVSPQLYHWIQLFKAMPAEKKQGKTIAMLMRVGLVEQLNQLELEEIPTLDPSVAEMPKKGGRPKKTPV